MTRFKPHIAIIIPGGIGTGKNNIGVPILERVIKLMTVDFNVTVFQLYKKNESYKAENFALIDTYSANPILKSIKFLFAFWKVQRHRRFKVVHGFWALPCGFLAVLVGKIFQMNFIQLVE